MWSEYYTRDSNKNVALKYLHRSQNSVDFLINEAKKYSTKIFDRVICDIYGISQNPKTNNYILVLAWASGYEKINNFIQEMQLKINNKNDVVFEWIPYNQFNKIKAIDQNNSITVHSAIWKNGPIYWNKQNKKYMRDSNKKVALKYLPDSHNYVDFLINEAKKYSTKNFNRVICNICGISQNPKTNNYILVLTWASGSEKIDNFIQERQLKIYKYNDIVLEWIPYNQFIKIKETDKNGFVTVYSAIWKDGPLYKFFDGYDYIRKSNKEVALKCLHNSQESVDSLINKAKRYSTDKNAFQALYGISQNPDTRDYILVVQNNYIHICENEKIDEFIQEMQLKMNKYEDKVFEWIPYNQFNKIREISKVGYSAIWKDGPLHYDIKFSNYTRNSKNKEVALKYLYNSKNSIDFLINKAKTYQKKIFGRTICDIYGITQNPNTYNYILVLAWTSGNEKIDDFIQEMQLKINNENDVVFEWIPYRRFGNVKKIGKGGFSTVYSAIWKDGPLEYDVNKKYRRDFDKEVALKYLHTSENSIDFLINKTKKYSAKIFGRTICGIYGISQNPDTNNYILVLAWAIGNKKIDNFILEMQLKINDYNDIVFEWIPYHQFGDIEAVGEGGFSTVYSAIWKDGPLEYDVDKKIYNRDPNKVIALKCLHNFQSITDKFLNEVKEYSINKRSNILNIYGISQNPDTKEYIIVLQYAKKGNFNHWINKNYEYFNWETKLFALIISDMGLCGEVGNIDKTKIYGVMPYVAPEVLRGKPYTQAADIYSFGMIMYFVATGRQPFGDRAHDHCLALDICKGIRPEFNESEAPRCYISLMKKCWDLDKNDRPNIFEVDELITSFYKSYGGNLFSIENKEIEMQFKEAEEYRKANLTSIENYQINTHPQAIYTSRLLNPFTEDLPKYDDDYNSQCLDQVI
ncbi:uncharacterized protein OCT59_008325 [Rhizophagus irregularis]|nr:hypothetical protein OCT59_008325 [Rhizophagus irregularis]